MSVLWLAVPISLSLAALAVLGFLWALHDGQLDDLETPALRPLLEDVTRAASRPGQPSESETSGAAQGDADRSA